MLLVVVWKTLEWPYSEFGHMELCHPMDEAQFIGQTLSHDVLCAPWVSVVVHLLLAGAESENQSLQGVSLIGKMEEPPQTRSRVPLAHQPCPPSTCFTRAGTCSSRARTCTCSSCARTCTCCSHAHTCSRAIFKPVVPLPPAIKMYKDIWGWFKGKAWVCIFPPLKLGKVYFEIGPWIKPLVCCGTMKWAYFKLKSLMGEKGIKCPLRQDGRVLSRFWTVTGHKQALSPGSPHSQLPQHRPEDETERGTSAQKDQMWFYFSGKQTG